MRGASPTPQAMMEVVPEQTTTAFLNAYIKKDQFAQDWPRNDTQRRLGQVGQIKEKWQAAPAQSGPMPQ